MTKAEMVQDLAARAGITKAATERVLDGLIRNLRHEVNTGGRYAFFDLGVFKKVARKARQRTHPQKPGEKVDVPAHNTVIFKPASSFYDQVNS